MFWNGSFNKTPGGKKPYSVRFALLIIVSLTFIFSFSSLADLYLNDDDFTSTCCSTNDTCEPGTECAGRRASCDIRLVFQNDPATLDLSRFRMSISAVSISGSYLVAGNSQTVESFIAASADQVRNALSGYLRTRTINPGELVVLDMEPGPAYFPRMGVLPVDIQERIIAAYKMRIRVARELMPTARLALWGVVIPIATGNEDSMESRMQVYLKGEEQGLYDDIDYLVPVLYPWFKDGETQAEMEARVTLATRQGIEKTLLLRKSDGSAGPALAPMLTFWGRVIGSVLPDGRAESRVLSPDLVNLQMEIIQEYGRVDTIGFWAPNETSGSLPLVDYVNFLENLRSLPAPDCGCTSRCEAPNCKAAQVGPFSLPDPPNFVPDRRPIKVINLFGGLWNHNVTGNIPWWIDQKLSGPDFPECNQTHYIDDGCLPLNSSGHYRYRRDYANNGIPDSIDELLRLLDEAYNAGWRRIVLNRPAGQYKGPDETFSPSREILPASQYWPMPLWKREGLEKYLKRWIHAHRGTGDDDISIGIYVGYRITSPCKISSLDRHVPDMSNPADACAVYQNLRPWIKIGIDQVWFDASSQNLRTDAPTPIAPEQLLQIGQSRNYRGIRIGGEAIPRVVENGQEKPNETMLAYAPFMALRRFYESFPCIPTRVTCRPGTSWVVPVSSEVGVGFQRDISLSPLSLDIVKDYVNRGFVPWAWSDSSNGFDITNWIIEACGGLATPCYPGSP